MVDFALAGLIGATQIRDLRPTKTMERRPFTIKERANLRIIARAWPLIIGYLRHRLRITNPACFP